MRLVALLLLVGVAFLVGRLTVEPPKAVEPAPGPVRPDPAAGIRAALAEELGHEPSDGAVEKAVRRAVAAIESADTAAARSVAAEVARQQLRSRGGAMAVLREVRESSAPRFDLVEDRGRFAMLFVRYNDLGTLRGEELRRDAFIPDGVTISFGPGKHVWHTRYLRNEFPRDLVVEGRGMDTTLVRLRDLSTSDEVHSLTFRDCTIDCDGRSFTDLRGGNPATIRMIRCRVIRFDGSVMLRARTAAFFASGCRFEAGFGRSRGSGNLFRVRSGLLVRVEDSVFVGPFRSVYDEDRRATYVFERCRFECQNVDLKSEPRGVRFIDCRATPPLETRTREVRPLSEINPGWSR